MLHVLGELFYVSGIMLSPTSNNPDASVMRFTPYNKPVGNPLVSQHRVYLVRAATSWGRDAQSEKVLVCVAQVAQTVMGNKIELDGECHKRANGFVVRGSEHSMH